MIYFHLHLTAIFSNAPNHLRARRVCMKEVRILSELFQALYTIPASFPSLAHELPDLRSPPLTLFGRGLGARGGGGLGLRAVITGLVLGLGPGGQPEQTQIIREA